MIRSRKGLTLTEFLLFTFINLIAIAIAAQLFMALNKDYKVLMTYLSSYLKGREAIDIMSKDIRIAVRVMDSHGAYTTTNDTLVLKVPSVDSGGNIIDVNTYFDYIVYRIHDGDLWKTVMPDPSSSRLAFDDVLKKDIESLYFAKDGVAFSSIAHKTTITHFTMWVSIVETVLGKEYRITPGTTVKLMNYEWEYVR